MQNEKPGHGEIHVDDTDELLVITDQFEQLVIPEEEENPGFDPYNNSE